MDVLTYIPRELWIKITGYDETMLLTMRLVCKRAHAIVACDSVRECYEMMLSGDIVGLLQHTTNILLSGPDGLTKFRECVEALAFHPPPMVEVMRVSYRAIVYAINVVDSWFADIDDDSGRDACNEIRVNIWYAGIELDDARVFKLLDVTNSRDWLLEEEMSCTIYKYCSYNMHLKLTSLVDWPIKTEQAVVDVLKYIDEHRKAGVAQPGRSKIYADLVRRYPGLVGWSTLHCW